MFITIHKYSSALKFNFPNKSNKQLMLSVTWGSELFWNRRDWTMRKRDGMWIWIQLPFIKNRMKISIKKATFGLPWNYLKLCKYQLSTLKNQKPASKLMETEVSLKRFLKKDRFIVEPIYTGNLHQLSLWMLKVFLVILDNFNLHFFFVRQPLVTDIFHKLIGPRLYNSF